MNLAQGLSALFTFWKKQLFPSSLYICHFLSLYYLIFVLCIKWSYVSAYVLTIIISYWVDPLQLLYIIEFGKAFL